MALTIISGTRGTANINSNRRKIDVKDVIYQLDPDSAPLLSLMMRLRKEKATNEEFKMFTDEQIPRWMQVNHGAGYSDSDTEFVIDDDDEDNLKIGDMVKIARTGEVMIVSATNTSTHTFSTASRSWGSTAAAAIVDNDWIVNLGNISEQGGTSPAIRSTQIGQVTNYCEIIKTPFEVTNTQDASDLYGGPDIGYLTKKDLVEHKIDIGRKFLAGEKIRNTGGSQPKCSTGGVLEFLADYTDTDAALTEKDFDEWMETPFKYGNNTRKILFASGIIIRAMNFWAKSKLIFTSSEKTYGVSIATYATPFGPLKVIYDRMLVNGYAGYGVLLDMDNLAYKYLRDTRLEKNIQANDADTIKHQYLTEAGLKIVHPKTHRVLKGVTSFS